MKEELRILLLEDSPLDAGIIEEHLRSGGIAFSSRRVETEASFRVALREFLPDVILLDNQLPAYSGTGALKLAREPKYFESSSGEWTRQLMPQSV
jgi:CheY-like chemotaxis protein